MKNIIFVPSVKCQKKLSHIYVEFSIINIAQQHFYMELYDYNSEWVRDNLFNKY